ncbi:MAG TPA: hypothetical protein VES88_14965 [Gemmatimonadaceae bacterium]|nr:hypothetical protein [Gemmatimonadaceae bacterium]
MITIPVTYLVGELEIEKVEAFDGVEMPPIESHRTNEGTLRAAIAQAPTEYRDTLNDLYREFVRSHFAWYDGKEGANAEPGLSGDYPDAGTLPGFFSKSQRFNAAGMVLLNCRHYRHAGGGYGVLPAILSALILAGLKPPRYPLSGGGNNDLTIAEEVMPGGFVEGAVREISVNAYERNAKARGACLKHYGYDCKCCGFNFERYYGEAGKEFIHVHHLVPLGAVRESYTVDPLLDLLPVCANCHGIIHRSRPDPYTVEDVKLMLQAAAM